MEMRRNMKTCILLSLASFTYVAFGQANRNDLRQPYRSELKDNEFSRSVDQRRQSINALSSRIQTFQQKLKAMEPKINAALGGTGLQPMAAPDDGLQRADPVVVPYSVRPSRRSSISVHDDQQNVQGVRAQPHRGNVGVYIMPFIALQGASPFDANIAELGNSAVSIKQELGFSSGWRIGKRWKNFFIDADFSYFRNKLKKPSVNTLVNASFSGAAEGYGGMLNFGGNFNPGTAVSILFGAGVGAFNQEIQASIPTPLKGLDNLALNFNETDTLFAYQLFTGINFYPTERILLSMKYRWLNIAEMEKFSARSLHMLELAFGYVF
jgi:opacity protein-like surface antigen